MVKSVPTAVGLDRAGDHVAFEVEGPGAQGGPVREGLIDGVEEVERAAEPLDQEEDEGGQQHGEDQPQPLAAPSADAG